MSVYQSVCSFSICDGLSSILSTKNIPSDVDKEKKGRFMVPALKLTTDYGNQNCVVAQSSRERERQTQVGRSMEKDCNS